jgi:hypothetical protein
VLLLKVNKGLRALETLKADFRTKLAEKRQLDAVRYSKLI